MMKDDIKEIIATKEEIADICKKVGKQITEDYQGKELVMVGLLNGCNPFFTDILREVDLKVKVAYMKVSSYHGTIKSTGEVKVIKDLDISIEGKDVIVFDDIIDTGKTLSHIVDILLLKGAKSIKTCVLLDKKAAREIEYNADYVGLVIPSKFVVGYGLDFNEYYRNLPYIGVLKEELYTK